MGKKSDQKINITLDEATLNLRIDQIEHSNLSEDARDFFIEALKALVKLDQIVGMKETTILRLRKIFGKKSEKRILPQKNDKDKKPKGGRKPGQGNNGKESYPLAKEAHHNLEFSKQAGQKCPECNIGALYKIDPGIQIRIEGSPSLMATIHKTEKTKCNACGAIFEADFEGKNQGKYAYSALSIIAIFHYLASFPFYRLEKVQKHLLTPMPRSVQWRLMEELANKLIYVWKAMLDWGREADLFHVDDTGAKILSVMSRLASTMKDNPKQRTGLHTTGIICKREDHKAVLFFTGLKYSSENLAELIETRQSDVPVAIMSDALRQNTNKVQHEFVQYLCMSHARRSFVDLDKKFTEECDYILKLIGEIYQNDKSCKDNKLTASERLGYHMLHSQALVDDIYQWIEKCFKQRTVEPNSTLGHSFKYMQNHREGLTAFLRHEGAPLDNNELESHLRIPVLNRKNWLFYKNEMGALVGDIILSVLKTCEANGIDPFQYLNFIQENFEEVKKSPNNYLPWVVRPSLIGKEGSHKF